MKASHYGATGGLIAFFVLVFAVSFVFHWHYPMLVVAGEASVGTWMSGALLVIGATLALVIGMRQPWPWFLVAAFFLVLSLDERFMFHERLKERLIFSFHSLHASPWLYELPVIVGACIGARMTLLLWNHLAGTSRVLLLGATMLGAVSVGLDVLAAGVFWEECCKLLAELCIALALLRKVTE